MERRLDERCRRVEKLLPQLVVGYDFEIRDKKVKFMKKLNNPINLMGFFLYSTVVVHGCRKFARNDWMLLLFKHCPESVIGCGHHEIDRNTDAEAFKESTAKKSHKEVVISFLMLCLLEKVVCLEERRL